MNYITITFKDGHQIKCPEGTNAEKLIEATVDKSGLPYLAVLINNDLVSLSYPLTVNSSIRFLSMADSYGWRVYRQSLCFILAKTVKELYPNAIFSIEHSFGQGLYCSFNNKKNTGITIKQLEKIEAGMRNLVKQNITIERHKISFIDAVEQFKKNEQKDKLNLLKYRNPPRVVIHWCDGFSDLAHGPLVTSTGLLTFFKLIPYKPGFVLHLPDNLNPRIIPPFQDQPHLFNVFQEHKKWGKVLGINTVGSLNEIIANNKIEQFIRTAETLHEKKLAQIADQISNNNNIKFIMIAGPSSSGKTTFAKRLSTHLAVNGLRSSMISLDNYFVAHNKTPRDKDGKLDFEHIKAVDLELFNKQLVEMIEGKEVELPYFNFETKKREFNGHKIKINHQVIIIEGIHGLNPELTEMVPPEYIFKIYISALTQLNVDSNNRISTTDNRLMRRIVRDYKFRGNSPLGTLRQWSSVRRGEKTWIFPFQGKADATFNSTLDYELAVLKPYVEPLLLQIKPSDHEYAKARRLSEFLLSFLGVSSRYVPDSSILREYIGGSSFHY